MNQRVLLTTAIVILLPSIACSQSSAEFSVDRLESPAEVAISLGELSQAREVCSPSLLERIESVVAVEVSRDACTQLGTAADELMRSSRERDLDQLDRDLLAESLLLIAREQALGHGRDTIVASDVQFFGIGFILEAISFRRSRGFLRVDSTPERSKIRIDDKPVGNTNRRFVLSPGTHSVSVQNLEAELYCRMLVDVLEDEEVRIHCPRSG